MSIKDLPEKVRQALVNPIEDGEPVDNELDIGKYARLKRLKQDDSNKIPIEGETIGRKLENLFRMTIAIPVPDIVYPLLAAYASLPSALSDILPILELRGEPGSGKSECIKIFSRVTGSTLNARSTAASIKNDINQIRWADPSTFSIEKNCFYLLDNADKEFFDERDVLTALLNGYDRYTDKQSISNGKGQNIPFYVFCPKVFTTVWRIDSPEIRRRLITVKFEPKQNLDQLINPDTLAINSLKKELSIYWNDTPPNWELHHECQLRVKSNFPASYSKQSWKLVSDVIVAGLCTGVWGELGEAFDFFEGYFEFRKKSKEGIYEVILAETLSELSGIPTSEWETSPKSILIEVDPKALKQRIDSHAESGLIPRIKPDQLQFDIRALGWRVMSKRGKYVYVFVKK
ncbi:MULTISPECIES: hypothetical protein [unclassified Microcoleus]|uniref:hypothetical protein n=1 Tax=unclassified Microcoleus TaxID=2642155 RepID=UPI002FD20857